MLNAFSVDLEEWYQAFDRPPPPPIGGWPDRLQASLDVLLELLARSGARASFFVVGEVAQAQPALVRRIAGLGHEVACHGHSHRRLTRLDAARFQEDLKRAVGVLGELAGRPIRGFRAPWFSLGRSTWWAVDVLARQGLLYDSSLFPVWNPFYGTFGCSPHPHLIRSADGRPLWEIPPAPTRLFGVPVPLAGGFYLRNAPCWLVRAAIRRLNRQGRAAVLYTHPWELDQGQPVLTVPAVERAIHYWGLDGWARRLARLLGEFRFDSMERVFAHLWTGTGGSPASGCCSVEPGSPTCSAELGLCESEPGSAPAPDPQRLQELGPDPAG
ncbi:MAG: polysaccharide deacetylase family protein [Candidatus Riflebacteria bacterium]|nr:polysaccharide deacetylase family protein [Candidatus Riflebacteria bacterium]